MPLHVAELAAFVGVELPRSEEFVLTQNLFQLPGRTERTLEGIGQHCSVMDRMEDPFL